MTDSYFLVDLAGEPLGMVDLDQITDDALLLMYQLLAVADAPKEIDRILLDWSARLDRDAIRLLVVCALAQMTKSIVDPLLVIQEKAHPAHRSRELFAQERDRRAAERAS
ncbi:hypothetical protein [Rhodococcus sp. JG-3]|uniref:hypothetical protein n=1 Tax=Rhodococcus sp. JG-3 TaxID=1305835 RepID=UPI00042A46BF|nr:hypothetical protein [Rhodococcus sp. JG-3]